MMTIHAFLYDPAFVNTASVFDTVLQTGGTCVLSPQGQSCFVNPVEFTDPRSVRNIGLNLTFTTKANLILDQTFYSSLISDIWSHWTGLERENLFTLLDILCFTYNPIRTHDQWEALLQAIPQYLPNSAVPSLTTTDATAYVSTPSPITCYDYVEFVYVAYGGTHYDFKIWLNNTKFLQSYPLSTIRQVVPPLPVSQLYTVDIVTGISGILSIANESSVLNQQTLQSYIASGEYTNYIAYTVRFVDTSGNYANVQFNILYSGALPGAVALRQAVRDYLLSSGIGTTDGWKARAPALFVAELWYLIPLWSQKTTLVDRVIYPNIVPVASTIQIAQTMLYDLEANFISSNINILTAFYNNLSVIAVPDPQNELSRLSLLSEHPTYLDVATTDPTFTSLTSTTQSFAALLGNALSVAAGNPNTNLALTQYTPPGDNRTYISFSVADVEYYVMTQATYNQLD